MNANNTDPLFPALDSSSEIQLATFIEIATRLKVERRIKDWAIGTKADECLVMVYLLRGEPIRGVGHSFSLAYNQFFRNVEGVLRWK